MLDERLSLAAAMYQPCALGADIGTDHALLPCHLLKENICGRMILADVSPKALRHAEEQVHHQHLEARARLVCADGLNAIDAPCGCVSVMGMGGETLSDIITRGQDKLRGAVLVLSAHTDLPMVRQAIRNIDYHIVREELCRAAGRFYVFWRAEPGKAPLTDAELRRGPLLMQCTSPLLPEYIRWRIRVLEAKLAGLLSATQPDEDAMATVRSDIAFYQARLEAISC